MGFIEKLRQEDAARAQHSHIQEEERDESVQKESMESGHRAERREQAEKFYQESGVKTVVDELIEYLETGRGSRGLPYIADIYTMKGGRYLQKHPDLNQRDPDSVLSKIHWDHDRPTGYGAKRGSYKYIIAESCPDGTIVFHGNWVGSTTLEVAKWRTPEKEHIFDRALEKAFRHPRVYRYSFYNQSPISGG